MLITEKPPLIPVLPPLHTAFKFSLAMNEGLCDLFDLPNDSSNQNFDPNLQKVDNNKST